MNPYDAMHMLAGVRVPNMAIVRDSEPSYCLRLSRLSLSKRSPVGSELDVAGEVGTLSTFVLAGGWLKTWL